MSSSYNQLTKSKNNNCLYETHSFNTKTKTWDPLDISQGLKQCLYSKCNRDHKSSNRPTQVCPLEKNCNKAGISCFLLHDHSLEPFCRYGKACIDLNCTKYRHPDDRVTEVCSNPDGCVDALITCFKLHNMSNITPICHYRNNCMKYMCTKRHPLGRKELCELGSMCWEYIVNKDEGCPKLHPKIFQKICRWDNEESTCRSYGCSFLHRPGAPIDCPVGMQCQTRIEDDDTKCPHKHPKYTTVKTLPDGQLKFE